MTNPRPKFKVRSSRYSKYELYLLYLAGVCTGKRVPFHFPAVGFPGFPTIVFLVFPAVVFPGSPTVGFPGFPAVFFPGFPGSGLEKAPERWYSTEMSGARGFRAGPDAEPTVGTP